MRAPILAAVALALALTSLAAAPAQATPPPNDDLAHPTRIASLPSTVVQDTSEATGSASDGRCVRGASVWFKFRPATATRLLLSTLGSDYDTILAVYAGRRPARTLVACNDDAVGLLSAVRLRATAGTRYWIAVSACCRRSEPGGHLQLNAAAHLPKPRGVVDVTGVASGGTTGGLVVSGTATCNTPSLVAVDLLVRQRVDPGVARGYAGDYGTTCMPGEEATWQVFVDSETGWAFQPGHPVRLQGSLGLLTGFSSSFESLDTVLTATDAPDARHGR